MRRKRGGMTCVPCDFAFDVRVADEGQRVCHEEFRSASFETMVPKQMILAGWRSRTTTHGTQWFCPACARRIGKLAESALASQSATEVSP